MIYLNDDIEGFDLEAALPLLSAQRRQQAMCFRHELGRKTCAAAYLLLRQALRQEYGILEPPVFSYGEHGKPVLAARPDIHFNLSHCREAVLCAVDSQPVGVDIESIREYRPALVSYTMNDREQRMIAEAERPDVAFTCLWTRKEAVLKLRGCGINNQLKDVLQGGEHIETVVNRERGYVYSIARAARYAMSKM